MPPDSHALLRKRLRISVLVLLGLCLVVAVFYVSKFNQSEISEENTLPKITAAPLPTIPTAEPEGVASANATASPKEAPFESFLTSKLNELLSDEKQRSKVIANKHVASVSSLKIYILAPNNAYAEQQLALIKEAKDKALQEGELADSALEKLRLIEDILVFQSPFSPAEYSARIFQVSLPADQNRKTSYSVTQANDISWTEVTGEGDVAVLIQGDSSITRITKEDARTRYGQYFTEREAD